MSESSKDIGLISVILQRLDTQRLPRALALKVKVDQGELLNDFDIEFLEEAAADANKGISLIKRHPEYQTLEASVIHLYKEIMDKAIKNEEES